MKLKCVLIRDKNSQHKRQWSHNESQTAAILFCLQKFNFNLKESFWWWGGWGGISVDSSQSLFYFAPHESHGQRRGGGLIGYVKSKPLGDKQIISLDVLVFVMIIAVFHAKLIWPPQLFEMASWRNIQSHFWAFNIQCNIGSKLEHLTKIFFLNTFFHGYDWNFLRW